VRVNIEKISAVTFKVGSMTNSVRFYRDVLGMEIIYGGEDDCFSSLRTQGEKGPILNLEQGYSVTGWGRLIFYVADVDAIWAHLREKGFIRRVRGTLPGASDISICPIRMGTSCHLRVHCDLRRFSLRSVEPEKRGHQARQRTGVELNSFELLPGGQAWKHPKLRRLLAVRPPSSARQL
jgi:catechol 2,3-dioxygenase-like lactoylglutathione lyase family enzyme